MITYSINKRCSKWVTMPLKLLRNTIFTYQIGQYLEVSQHTVLGEALKKPVLSDKADVYTKWINATEREFCNNSKKYIFIFPLQYPLKKTPLDIHCQKIIKNT